MRSRGAPRTLSLRLAIEHAAIWIEGHTVDAADDPVFDAIPIGRLSRDSRLVHSDVPFGGQSAQPDGLLARKTSFA